MTPSAPQRSAARFVATFLLAGVIALGLAAWVFVAQPPPAASPRGGAQTTPTTQTGAARIALVVREVPHYAVEGERLEAALSLTLGPDAGKQDVSVSAFVGSAQVARVAGAVRGGEARAVDVSLGHVRAGAWPVEISAEGAEGSATVAWLLEVAPRPIRVLCVEARPRWEHRYFVDALLADAALRVQCVLLEADPEAVQKASVGVAPLTKLPEQFDDFDVVILGEAVAALTQEFMPREASWADRLRAWVRDQGGSVLLVAGEGGPYLGTSLEDLLPVACQRSEDEPTRFDVPFRLVLAREGLDSPLTRLAPDRERNREYWAADLPLHYWYRSGWAREGSHVLAGRELSGGATAPLIAWRSYGRGCVLWHGLDSLWRWRAEVGTRPFERYVGRAIRFLGVQAARVEGRAGTDAPGSAGPRPPG